MYLVLTFDLLFCAAFDYSLHYNYVNIPNNTYL